MGKITDKLRLTLLDQCITQYSEYFQFMTDEDSKSFLNCLNNIIISNDRIIIESSISNMYLIASRLNINSEEKKYKTKVARSMIEQEYSNVDIHELKRGWYWFEIYLTARKWVCAKKEIIFNPLAFISTRSASTYI